MGASTVTESKTNKSAIENWEYQDALGPSESLSATTLTAPTHINHITTNAPYPDNMVELSTGRRNLRRWLGQTFRVVITDGRVLVGYFNCTDKDANVVMSACAEYLEEGKDARLLGNVMIPGHHIVSISVDLPKEEALVATNTAGSQV